jgi:hypothetical protein
VLPTVWTFLGTIETKSSITARFRAAIGFTGFTDGTLARARNLIATSASTVALAVAVFSPFSQVALCVANVSCTDNESIKASFLDSRKLLLTAKDKIYLAKLIYTCIFHCLVHISMCFHGCRNNSVRNPGRISLQDKSFHILFLETLVGKRTSL